MRRSILILAALAFASGCGSCSSKTAKHAHKPVVKKDAGAKGDAKSLAEKREAFGLPYPPEVVYVRKGSNYVEVGTKLRISELEKFFKERLVDYEYVKPHRGYLKIVGLHSYMPSISIYRRAWRSPRAVRYHLPAPPPGRAAPGGVATLDKPRPAHHQKGDPVTIKLPDGKPLAPGAHWGEPYTPPPNSPLHKPRFRANWGKPFGSWVPD